MNDATITAIECTIIAPTTDAEIVVTGIVIGLLIVAAAIVLAIALFNS